jgi:formylglycine-generating enzyme required for sulfatase activity
MSFQTGPRGPYRSRWAAALAALLFLAGCGEQELYSPPSAPIHVVGRLALPSEPQDVAVLGETAYLACGQAGLLIVDLADPAHPVLVKMLDTVKFAESVKTASTAYGGAVVDIAFVVEGTEGITTYDITDPANAFSFNQGTTAVDGNGMFVETPEDPTEPYTVYLAESWKGVRLFESSPATPGLLAYNGVFTDTRGFAKSIVVREGFAYVADDELGLAVVDVRTRILGSVKVVSSCDTEGYARGVAVDGDYAFVADYHAGLAVMELREETDSTGEDIQVPYLVATLPLGGRSQAIVVRDGLAFLAAQDGGVHVVDVSSPLSPVYLGTVVTLFANGIAAAENGLILVSDRDDGLIVLGGIDAFTDERAPSPVWTVAATAASSNAVRLEWTAPGDDGLSGAAAEYDIRFASSPIATLAEWDAAAPCSGEPVPSRGGAHEKYWATGLAPGTEYHFALRARDDDDNWSSLSNPTASVTADSNISCFLASTAVHPGVGVPGSTFTLEATYVDWDGDAPVTAEVFLDGVRHDLSPAGGDYRDGALYSYQITLDSYGQHEHFFVFSDGQNAPVYSDTLEGPGVGYVFTMGSPESEAGRDLDEALHEVALTHEVIFSDHEVTQEEYEALIGSNPSRHLGAALPVENVSWYEAVAYCNALSLTEGRTEAYTIIGTSVAWNREADGYRLPTEAEWERACRAGTSTAFAGGSLTTEACGIDPVLDAAGWYCGNASGTPHPVRAKQANAWNLYDMHGNVWEWCFDWYEADLGASIELDPSGPETGSQKVVRGGSWYYFARECRSASRAPYWPNSKDDLVGFRVVRTVFE